MKTCAITLIKFSAFAATVLASPASLVQRQAITICNNGDAKCCDVDILGIAALDCIDRTPLFASLLSLLMGYSTYYSC